MPGIGDSRCVLVIGATSGIGKALAEALHALPSKPTVIAAGRRKERLAEMKKDRLEAVQVDVGAGERSTKAFVADVTSKYPELDAVVFCAGIQRAFDFTKPESVDLSEITAEMNTNYLAIVTMIAQFLPHLLKIGSQGRPCFIIPVTSSLAMVPNSNVPNYCASKAALHSFGISLSAQLQGTNVHVSEVMPPLVESELHDQQGTTQKLSEAWMPLDEFTRKEMEGLTRGDLHVPVGMSADNYEKYNEKGKVEQAMHMHERIKAMSKGA